MTTIVILDLAHCGTTMTTQVIERLGVPMLLGGDRGHNHEDAEIARALRKRASFEALVAARGNGHHWGFKHPGGWRFAPYFDCLPDPVYLAIYKEPVSAARRHSRQHPHQGQAFYINATLARMVSSLAGILASGLPVHYLSYLDAVRDPYGFATTVADTCGLGVTDRQLHRAAEVIRLEGCEYA